ncbi:putative phosphatase phospho1 [Mortierella polycephala]|uniref:Phosphatase phospho1 n=1 Tax=Mortierella polycephala TaxID=41804 RepID=A0A9P6U696_9FUNG|nr:putative phosphatase phospho1 [Mortierella polycephala]
MPSTTVSKRLFAFDFDWTLIEADSDHWVMQRLSGDLFKEQEDLFGKMQWTDLQNMLLGRLFDRGVTKQDIEQVLHEIPFTQEVITALRLMESQGAELCIISDANTFYIETILKMHGIDTLFTKIITNPAHFDESGRLHVSRFHGADKGPHGCALPCQPNLCKGRELQKLIDSQAWDQVVYMGDSTNDFCPSTRLQSKDLILARSKLLLEKAIREQPHLVLADVVYWESPSDILATTQSIFNIESTKPLPSPQVERSGLPSMAIP